MENQNELKHYGVLGMKWGQHKARVNSMKKSMYSKNAKISSDFKKSKGKSGSVKNRTKTMSSLNDKNKNRVVSKIKALLKTSVNDRTINRNYNAGRRMVQLNPIFTMRMGTINTIAANQAALRMTQNAAMMANLNSISQMNNAIHMTI